MGGVGRGAAAGGPAYAPICPARPRGWSCSCWRGVRDGGGDGNRNGSERRVVIRIKDDDNEDDEGKDYDATVACVLCLISALSLLTQVCSGAVDRPGRINDASGTSERSSIGIF